jgi:hypothetical protein
MSVLGSYHRDAMRAIGPQKDPVLEMLRRMIAEFADEHYHTCPADNDSGPCDCFAGHLLTEARLAFEAAAMSSGIRKGEA